MKTVIHVHHFFYKVKSLLTLPPEANTPISTVHIRELPRCQYILLSIDLLVLSKKTKVLMVSLLTMVSWYVTRVPADTPLYDVLNEFRKGKSHMAAVVNRNAGKNHWKVKYSLSRSIG